MKRWGAWPLPSGPTIAGVLSAVLLFAAAPVSANELLAQQTAATPAAKDLVLRGDAVCTRCHDEEDAPGVLTIGRTKHGTRADSRTPTCTTCHGESQAHINKPEGMAERPKVDRAFGKGTHTPATERADTCLGCHKGAERIFWETSAHAAMNLACDSCHQVHNGGTDRVRDRQSQPEVCFSCHKQQRVQVHKPSRHPMLEGVVVCADCHNPHGSAGPKMMVRDTVNDTCFTCHAEKRGPFLWQHQPVTEDCAICHDPHGTTVASLLKWRPPFLCQQCHEATTAGTHQGNIPSVHIAGTTSGRGITLARACLNCHTLIHGSNNPIANSASRSFRQ